MAFEIEIEFYSSMDGKEPVVVFLDSLDVKMAVKMIGLMEILEEKTPAKELKLAKTRRADWLSRHREG